jgi:hypothetical protein
MFTKPEIAITLPPEFFLELKDAIDGKKYII